MQSLDNTYTIRKISLIFILYCIIAISCKKFVDIDPPTTQVVSETVFNSDATATATILGIYSEMMNSSQQFSAGHITLFAGLSADELYYYTPGTNDEFTMNQISISNPTNASSFWQRCYKYIYTANLCIEGINKSGLLSASVKSTLLGEAKFIRAFCYFHLINLYGDVPLITSSDYRVNSSLPRSSISDIYKLITSDLKDAKNLLPVVYLSVDKVRPNKWTATSLLARVYLYNQNWDEAEAQASEVINSATYSLPTNLNQVFLKSSAETIWQLLPVNTTNNTWEGNVILPASPSSTPTFLFTSSILNDFEASDQRRNSWVASRVFQGQTVYYPFKYKIQTGSNQTEYYVVFRLAEQYLIRSEAKARKNNLSGALADLNTIRNRSGLPNSTAIDQASLLLSIEHERRIEFMSEWGNRWYDLKRTNRIDAILGLLKPATWQSTDKLWPIPVAELNANPALVQNPGY
jgi:hypothetical protein